MGRRGSVFHAVTQWLQETEHLSEWMKGGGEW